MSATPAARTTSPAPPLWRRLAGFNLLTGILLGIGGFYLGWFGAHWLINGLDIKSVDYFGDTDQNDLALFFGYILGVIGFLVGLGFAAWASGRRQFMAPVTKYLPRYAGHYLPDPPFRAG